jgi:hypothetical protein
MKAADNFALSFYDSLDPSRLKISGRPGGTIKLPFRRLNSISFDTRAVAGDTDRRQRDLSVQAVSGLTCYFRDTSRAGRNREIESVQFYDRAH